MNRADYSDNKSSPPPKSQGNALFEALLFCKSSTLPCSFYVWLHRPQCMSAPEKNSDTHDGITRSKAYMTCCFSVLLEF